MKITMPDTESFWGTIILMGAAVVVLTACFQSPEEEDEPVLEEVTLAEECSIGTSPIGSATDALDIFNDICGGRAGQCAPLIGGGFQCSTGPIDPDSTGVTQ